MRVARVIVLFEQTLMVDAVGIADLEVEEAWQDEADAGRTNAADVGENTLQARDGEGHKIAKYKNERRQECEAEVAHGASRMIRARRWRGGIQKRTTATRRVRTSAASAPARVGSPLQNSIHRRTTRMHLKWDGKRHKDDDADLPNQCGNGRSIYDWE